MELLVSPWKDLDRVGLMMGKKMKWDKLRLRSFVAFYCYF
jgi:hypothetical protein